MKTAIKLICLSVLLCCLFGCGAPAQDTTPTTLPTAPTETQPTYPTPDKRIALTFDDGPNRHMGVIIDVLPQILHDLKLAGYELVTVTELFGGSLPAPSQTYKQNGTN